MTNRMPRNCHDFLYLMMMKTKPKIKLIVCLFLFSVLLPSFSVGADDYEFIVIRKKGQKQRVAVPEFRTLSELPKGDTSVGELTRLMREGLEMTGLFEVVSPDSYPSSLLPGGREDMSAWRLIGVDILIRGDIAYIGKNKYQVEIRCFDVISKKMTLGKRYSGSAGLFNRMVMRYLDELLGWLTGRAGFLASRIAYVSDITGRNEIRVMDTDGSHNEAVTNNRTLNLSPTWSPDGRYILYTGYRARNPDLYLTDIDKNKEWRIFGKRGLNIAGEFRHDNKMIAFTREGEDGNIDIYMIGTDGRNLKRLTHAYAIEVSPTWSPDGKLLAFVSDRTGSPQIYILDLSQGAESQRNPAVRLSQEGRYNTSPAWSPDGQYIAYAGKVGGQFDLFLIRMYRSERPVERLTATKANEENPAWSPDSRFLVYDSNKAGNYDIQMMSIYGGTPRRLTKGAAKDSMPVWSSRVQQ